MSRSIAQRIQPMFGDGYSAKGYLLWKKPVDYILCGIVVRPSSWSKAFYLDALVIPTYVPLTQLAWRSDMVRGLGDTNGIYQRDDSKLPSRVLDARSEAERFWQTLDTPQLLVASLGWGKHEADTDALEIRAGAHLLQGDVASARRLWNAIVLTANDEETHDFIVERARLLLTMSERDALRQLETWRKVTLAGLNVND
jgi:hypothetical protein